MISFVLKILKAIVLKLATTGTFNFLMPTLLKIDKYLEDKLGIDIIKQNKKFQDVYPLVSKRVQLLEKEVIRLKKQSIKDKYRKKQNV
mgnify:FL=1